MGLADFGMPPRLGFPDIVWEEMPLTEQWIRSESARVVAPWIVDLLLGLASLYGLLELLDHLTRRCVSLERGGSRRRQSSSGLARVATCDHGKN